MIAYVNLRWRGLVTSLLLLVLLCCAFNTHAQVPTVEAQTSSDALRAPPPPGDDDPPINNANFSSQSLPTTMTVGDVYTVTLRMLNSGNTTWTSGAAYSLGSSNPRDNGTWGTGRVALAGNIPPGWTATFTFQISAPTTPGSYNFQWQMVQDGVEWFGAPSTNVVVDVVPVPRVNNAVFAGQSVPATMTAGTSNQVSVSMYNNGNTTWTRADPYALGSLNPQDNGTWGTGRAWLAADVAPGQTGTFTFQAVAPSTPGSYNFQWGMLQSSCCWFGDPSANVVVNVVAAPRNDAAFVGQSVTATMITGGQYPVSLTFTNNGTTTWDPTNGKYVLLAVNPVNNETWVYSRIPLPGAVAPGQQVTIAWTTRAPTTAGTYNFMWSLLQEGVQIFGATSPNVAVVVSAPGPQDTVTYIHTDALGSPVARSDSAGNIVSRTSYEPYGLTAGGVTPTIGFTGHVNDADTGLVYMQQRYYDPVAGRFLSVDPVTTDASTGSSFNRYAYANNSPYKYVDPDGRNWALAGRGAILGAELGSVAGPWGAAAGAIIVGGGTLWLGDKAIKWIASSSNADSSKASPNTTSEGKSDSKSGSNGAGNNPYKGPATEPVTVVDQHGNAIPVDQGQRINTSPNGDFQQVIGADGKPTGDRLDRGGHPGQRDPSAQKPHGHRPGVTTPDGNPHLPIKPEVN